VKVIVVILFLFLIVFSPLTSAYAEAMTVTTSKGIYAVGENVIIVGIIPSTSSNDYAVIIKVTGPNGKDCVTQNILPSTADKSFVSRPIKLDGCGFGQYTVTAFYNGLKATSNFEVSNYTQTGDVDGGGGGLGKLELRLLRSVIVQARDAVNQRVHKLIDDGYILPEDIAEKYGNGVSEASLVLQAVDFGDHAEAKKHLIIAIGDFRDVLDMLSAEHLALFEQVSSSSNSSNNNNAKSSLILEAYSGMQEYYYRLEELAQKNQIDKKSEFKDVASLLASSKQQIDNNDTEGAEKNLSEASNLLEGIRTDLFESKSSVVQLPPSPSLSATSSMANGDNNNATAKIDEESIRLSIVADKFERAALNLLNKTGSSNLEAKAKLNEALSLIASARNNLDLQDHTSTRQLLSSAYKAFNEARSLLKEDENG
jgi:hypothetical protein